MSAPSYPNEKSGPPPGHEPQPYVNPASQVLSPGSQQQPYSAPVNRPLQAGVGAPEAANPECRHYGHDTHIGCGGITFLVCCFPWSMIWLCVRQKATCRRCGLRVDVAGPID